MNFDFSDDQKFLKNEARKFLEANCPTSRVRKVLDDDSKAYDAELWAAVAGQGWLGAAIAAGEVIGWVATSEGPGVVTAAGLKASVSGGKLSGTKLPVIDGDIATHA